MAAVEKPKDILSQEFQEEDLAVSRSSVDDTLFDSTIGHIEDIIMEEEFQRIQNDFLQKYYKEFDDGEENKFIYTDIHKSYVTIVEKFIENELIKRIPGFSMATFQNMLTAHRDELHGEVFEILLTFSDFLAFKEMVLDYKAEQEGRTIDLKADLTVTSLGLQRSVSCPAPAQSSSEPLRRQQGPSVNSNMFSIVGQGLSIAGKNPLSLTGTSCVPNTTTDNLLCITGSSAPTTNVQNTDSLVDNSDDNHEPMVISPRESLDM